MFMGTFTATAMQWFSGPPNGHITSFPQFAKLFREQFYANQVKPPELYDLFNVRQKEGEMLKVYLNRFWALTVRLQTHDEKVMVTGFGQGVASGPFCNTLIRNPPETILEIRRRAVVHINVEEAVTVRNGSSHSQPAKPRNTNKASRPMRVHETSAVRHAPYKRGDPRARFREEEVRPKFRISYKKLIAIPAVAEKLRFPGKAKRNLGPKKDAWCDFHKGFGHNIERCLALGRQLAKLLNEGFLKEYCEARQEEPRGDTLRKDPPHEIPMYGKIKTILGGFSGGGSSAIERKRYARAVMSVET